MPSSVIINGRPTNRPGVYSKIDASGLSARSLAVNNLAVVGQFSLPQGVPTTYFSQAAFLASDPDDDTVVRLAKLIYSPASDDRIPSGGPASVTLLNFQPNTQASRSFQSVFFEDVLLLKSKLWGIKGNQVRVNISPNVVDATQKDVIITLGTQSETFEKVFIRNGTTLPVEVVDNSGLFTPAGSDVTLRKSFGTFVINQNIVDFATGLAVAGPVLSALSPKMGVDGVLTLTVDQNPGVNASGAKLVISVTGLDSGGAAQAETYTWFEDLTGGPTLTSPTLSHVGDNILDIGGGGPLGQALTWSAITSFTATATETAPASFVATAYDLNIDAMNVTTPGDLKVFQLVDLINNIGDGTGYSAQVNIPSIKTVRVWTADDNTSPVSFKDDNQPITFDHLGIVQALQQSSLVTSEASAGILSESTERHPPVDTVGVVYLLGGGESPPTDGADITAALIGLESLSIQTIACLSAEGPDVSACLSHARYMQGRNERNVWAGAPSSQTRQEIVAVANGLNSRHLSLVFQGVEVSDPVTGGKITLNPSTLALMMASMQTSTSTGTPLTWKRPNILGAQMIGGDWNVRDDVELFLLNGLVVVTPYRLGWRVERDLTTYTEDDNPIYSKVGANESFNTSVRDVRENLEFVIGTKNFQTTAGKIRSRTRSRLDFQVENGIIKAYLPDSVAVEDLGDRFRVRWSEAPIEGVDFVIAEATATRIAGT